MNIPVYPFEIIDWNAIPKEERKGETGFAVWQVISVGSTRIRKLQYSANYKADHWCKKGHIMYCLEGQRQTELEDGRVMELTAGKTYIVGDNCEAHRSSTKKGCVLFVVD